MNPLAILRDFDQELYAYFEKEIGVQHSSLSFIPDENSTSPLCASIMGAVLVNSSSNASLVRSQGLENMAKQRLCSLFNAEYANVKSTTNETASRVVFHAISQRGDVIMSLDLRKKEHCNSEELAYRFVNFGVDPETQRLDYEAIEKQARECKPHVIIVSPINYSLAVDYARFAKIASSVGALLWCDISQISGLIAAGVIPSPLPHADVVTFTSHGPMQGPQGCIILAKRDLTNAIERAMTQSGHHAVLSGNLAALCARTHEMEHDCYKEYARAVVENTKALAEGLKQGGMKIISDSGDTHLLVIDSAACAIGSRGAQELLSECGINVRTCDILTQNPKIKFEGVRFSTLASTTRGVSPDQLKNLGEVIGIYLKNPEEAHGKRLSELVQRITASLSPFASKWLADPVKNQLTGHI